jgi:polysaccharide biosynthesis transport protein
LRQEAVDSRELYEELLKRLKEAGVLEGLKSSNITVVDPGRTPARPSIPNVPIYMSIAIGAGLFLASGAAFWADRLDNKIHGIKDLEDLLGVRIIGALPQFAAPARTDPERMKLLSIREPSSTYTEVVRSIRTSLLLAQGDKPPKVILVTSSIAGEGKSEFSANLATIMAQGNSRVLLVDADLRKSTLAKKLQLPSASPGLSELLAGQLAQPSLHHVEGALNLDVLLAGATPPNPAELLGAQSMKTWLNAWRGNYDFIVLDGTPILPVTDAVILHYMADVTLLLARSKLTLRPQLERAYHMLTHTKTHYVGVVFNSISPQDSGYYNYYGYYGYRKKAYQETRDDERNHENES